MKKCSECKEFKELIHFGQSSRSPDGLNYYCKDCVNRKSRKWKNTEKGKLANRLNAKRQNQRLPQRTNEYDKKRKAEDPSYKLSKNLRSRVSMSLKRLKPGSAIKDLGCTVEELKRYLESKFQPGMTWENYSRTGWHIDHIKPLSSFDLSNREEFLKAVHYTNLQPLWAHDNLSKSAKIVLDF